MIAEACAAYQAAREVWPGIDVGEEVFVDLVRERLAADPELQISALPTADLYIACACAGGDSRAIASFEARYFTGLDVALARAAPTPTVLDEVKQILREKWFVALPGARPRIVDAVGHGDLGGLVRVAAMRTLLNLRRQDHRLEPSGDDSLFDAAVPPSDPALSIVRANDRAALKEAFEDAVRALEPRERNVLRLHVLHQLSIDEIGRIFGVHRATCARWLERIRETLAKRTRTQLADRLALDRSEVESLVALVQSRLEVSFARLLATDPPSHDR